MQKQLDEYLKPLLVQPSSKFPSLQVAHRDLIIKALQLGVASKEENLLRFLRKQIGDLRTKGRNISWIDLRQLRIHLHQLAKERIAEKIGLMWQLRR